MGRDPVWRSPAAGRAREKMNVESGGRQFPGREARREPDERGRPYSVRRVLAGSTRAARHAGTAQATSDTAASSAITPR